MTLCEHKFYDLYGLFKKEEFKTWRAYLLSERYLIDIPRKSDLFVNKNSQFEQY